MLKWTGIVLEEVSQAGYGEKYENIKQNISNFMSEQFLFSDHLLSHLLLCMNLLVFIIAIYCSDSLFRAN